MNRFHRLPGLWLVLGLLLTASCRAEPVRELEVVVLGTADVHGRLFDWDYSRDQADPAHSLLRLATLIEAERARHPHVLLLDAGDLLQGNPFADFFAEPARADGLHPMLEALDLLAYGAITLGNHEFNFGVDYIERQCTLARTPCLAGNVLRHGSGEPAFEGLRMFEFEGVRIAVLGLTTPGSAVWDRPHVAGRLAFADGVEAGRRLVEEARAQGAHAVIALLHSGLEGGQTFEGGLPENFGRQLVETVPGLDLVILSHTHQAHAALEVQGAEGRTVRALQPGRWASHLGRASLRFAADADGGWRLGGVHTELLPAAEAPPHPRWAEHFEEQHQQVRARMGEPLAQTGSAWSATRSRLQPTPLLDLVHAVQREASGAQLSAAAAFTVDLEIAPGPITRGHLARLYPYENQLHVLELDGAALRRYLEHSAAYLQLDESGLPQPQPGWPGFNFDTLHGVEYQMDLARPVGRRLLRLEFEGAPVRDEQVFTLAVNSYRAEGGGAYPGLEDARRLRVIDSSVRELIEGFLQQRGQIEPEDLPPSQWAWRIDGAELP